MGKKKIGIVGAGASGIIKAILLKDKGYDVTLYEKGSKIAGSTKTIFQDGKPYDLSTKMIPAISLDGHHVQPDFRKIAESTEFHMGYYPDAVFYDFKKNKRVKIPEPLKQYSVFKILSDFVKGYDFLVKISECFDIEEIHEKGLCLPGENLEEWGKRYQMEAFATFSAYVADLFLMGPAYTISASYCMASRVYYLTPYLHKFLSKEPFATLVKFHPKWKKNQALIDFISRPSKGNYLYFKGGYEPFFNLLVKKHQLDVQLNSDISNIRNKQQKVLLDVNGNSKEVDALIFCCPLHLAADSVADTDLSNFMKEGKPRRHARVWTLDLQSWDHKKFSVPALVGDGRNELRLGHKEMQIKSDVYGIEKFFTTPIGIAAVYLDTEAPEEESYQALQESLPKMGVNLREIISYEDFEYSYPASNSASKEGWYTQMKNLQGKNGLYFSGQMFCGSGVVTIAAYSKKFVERYFKEFD